MSIPDPHNDDTPAEPTGFHAPAFIASGPFETRWKAARLTSADLTRLYVELAADPAAGDVIPGAGGLRKLRFAPEGKGKSGSVRVCYANMPHGIIVLFALYAKSERANLSKTERNAAANWLGEFEKALNEFADNPAPDQSLKRFLDL